MEAQTPVRVRVWFAYPMSPAGYISEEYDLREPGDIASWQMNEKLLKQTSVKTVETLPANDALTALLASAQKKGRALAKELRREMA